MRAPSMLPFSMACMTVRGGKKRRIRAHLLQLKFLLLLALLALLGLASELLRRELKIK